MFPFIRISPIPIVSHLHDDIHSNRCEVAGHCSLVFPWRKVYLVFCLFVSWIILFLSFLYILDFGDKIPYLIHGLQIFSWNLLLFHLVRCWFCCGEAFEFDVVPFAYFCFYCMYFWCYIQKIIANNNVEELPMFLLSFIVIRLYV